MRWELLALATLLFASGGDGEFDWKRDAVLLKNGKEERGVVIEACDPEQVVLLLDGGRRARFPLAEVERVDKLRDRLASFMSKHRAGLSIDAEWQLLQDAERVGLAHMARVQAYHILSLEGEHAGAHEFLGHRRSGSGWNWAIDGKNVAEKKFHEMSRDWNSRLVLESEHFALETDCGLKRGVALLFDLEGQYLWWMTHLGPELRATEDVDDPRSEKITFLVHKNFESFRPLVGKEPYYDPSGTVTTSKGGINVARTYYERDGARPLELFELGAQSLIYSTLVLGETKSDPGLAFKRNAHWVEVGLAYWVAQHCGGPPGYPEFKQPLDGTFALDFDTARRTLERVNGGPLSQARHELANLIGLFYENFVGTDVNIPLYKARSASFVSFLIEVNPPVMKNKKELGRGRDGLWHYFREVYGTPKAHSSSAFDDGFGGAKVESLEGLWKAWTRPFASVVGK